MLAVLRSLAKGLAVALFFAVVALLLTIVLVPPFLDSVVYRGPVSDHYDGQHFFNPGDARGAGAPGKVPPRQLLEAFLGRNRIAWPASVPVTPTRPAARVSGEALRVTWIGHSTVLVQTRGLNILTDPILSDRTGPFALGPRRVRAPGVRFEDLPRIDLILVSHVHYDHLDLPTLRRLWTRDRPLIVTPLGIDTLLRRAGIGAVARDWGGRVRVRPGIDVLVEQVHHWGSRWMSDRNRALWSGFTLRMPGGNLFFAGDTGYGDGRWVARVAAHGPFRFAILPIGAFEPAWMMRPSHVDPAEAVRIFARLGAARALGVHWGTFRLSEEGIDAPRLLLRAALRARHLDPVRFRATEPGVAWDVPPLPPPA